MNLLSDALPSEHAGIASAVRWWGVLDEADDKSPDIQFDGTSFMSGLASAYGGVSLHASRRKSELPATLGGLHIGFRVASIPEPSTGVLGSVGLLCVLWWRRAAG